MSRILRTLSPYGHDIARNESTFTLRTCLASVMSKRIVQVSPPHASGSSGSAPPRHATSAPPGLAGSASALTGLPRQSVISAALTLAESGVEEQLGALPLWEGALGGCKSDSMVGG